MFKHSTDGVLESEKGLHRRLCDLGASVKHQNLAAVPVDKEKEQASQIQKSSHAKGLHRRIIGVLHVLPHPEVS